jgi:3-deoxy-D-manno-octulosonic-acid transferase
MAETRAAIWAHRLYSLLLYALQPAYWLKLWWRGRTEPLYRHAMAERFGRYTTAPSSGWLWVHAVSLGETLAAKALLTELRQRNPDLRLLLTHGTATGMEAGKALLNPQDHQTWLPYDTPSAVQRFLAQFEPAMGLLMETEIWPNLLRAAKTQGVPMVLANARLSKRSFRKGLRFATLLRPAVQSLKLVLAQTQVDARRLNRSGARSVHVCGNLKFELTPQPAQLTQGAQWREKIKRHVVLAAVTREGEEAMLLNAWRESPLRELNALLVIVPRHPQRFDEVAALVRGQGLTLARRSSWEDTPNAEALKAQVWLGDSMREMSLYYACAHVALMGGSFAPLGSHNLIEAAACACPLVVGPSTFNFKQAARLSLAAGASMKVADMSAALVQVNQLLRNPQKLATTSVNALRFSQAHSGAAQRMAQHIQEALGPRPGLLSQK